MKIKAAAILHGGRTWTGRRHHEILRQIADQTNDWPITSEQGFVTDDGRFVGREEAAQIAFAAGQILKPKAILFSEDIFESCVHEWAHIEDHHVICKKCKHTADLCWTCESEKTKTRSGGSVCLKCNPQ